MQTRTNANEHNCKRALCIHQWNYTPTSISEVDTNSSIPKKIEPINVTNCYDRIRDTNTSDIIIEDDDCDERAMEYDNS